MKLYFVRHGETAYNKEFRFLGRTDIGLSENGRLQAAAVAERLRAESIGAVYSSEMVRARETAEVIARPHALSVVPVKDLCEIDFGRWEGLTYGEIEALDPEYVRKWVDDPINVDIPGGESWAEFRSRLVGALQAITASSNEHGTVIVSHGGPIKALLSYFQGDDLDFFKSFWPSPGSLSIVDWIDGRAEIVALNDITHVQPSSST